MCSFGFGFVIDCLLLFDAFVHIVFALSFSINTCVSLQAEGRVWLFCVDSFGLKPRYVIITSQ